MTASAEDLAVVIMAGGAGTRFWPVSTESRPKQFLDLFGGRTMLQRSFDRAAGLTSPERILVLTNASFAALVREQLPELPARNVIGEPMRRDTAAAVVLAACLVRRRFGDPVMAVFTADHLIEPAEEFRRSVRSASSAAAISPGALYTFGIAPEFPATGYGYLERGRELLDDQGIRHFQLQRFKEKPDRVTAERYIESGRFYWNSGMFVWSVDAILEEAERQIPEHARLLAAVAREDGSPRWEEALRRGFEPLRRVSIDYGVMEGAKDVRCVEGRFSWSDVGGWLALEQYLGRDGTGNASRGRLKALDASSNIVFCENPREVVALVGVEGLVVVRSGDRTLVVPRDRAEEVKELVARLSLDLR